MFTTLSTTDNGDNDQAWHYDQMYKDGHIGKTVHLYHRKRKIYCGGTGNGR